MKIQVLAFCSISPAAALTLALQVFTDATMDQSFIVEVLVRPVCAAARPTSTGLS